MGIKSLRELQFEWKGKVLILSDIHYPYCDMNQINEIILNEKPSLIILLGDIITKNKKDYITFMNSLAVRRNVIYVRGDDDKLKGDVDIVRLRINNRSFTLLHGHQYFKQNIEYNLAKFLKKINSKIPPLLFCLAFRLFLRTNDCLILGHSHVLAYFRSLNCANAGTLSNIENLYNDKGYITIDERGNIELHRI